MSVKEIKENLEQGNVLFGLKQALKSLGGKSKGKGKSSKIRVFVAKDARENVFEALEKAKIEFDVLKNKEEISKDLGLDFESEVYSIK